MDIFGENKHMKICPKHKYFMESVYVEGLLWCNSPPFPRIVKWKAEIVSDFTYHITVKYAFLTNLI